MIQKRIFVNGREQNLFVEQDAMLSDVLRDQAHITGVKIGCGEGVCGACNVIMDGKLIRSCITKMKRVPEFAQITTIEGIGTPNNLHPLQQAWIHHGSAQCGYCTPGFIVSAKALYEENPKPTREEVRDWFQKHKNLCRCTGYKPLVDAVMDGFKVMRGEMSIHDLEFKMPADGKIWGTKYPRPTAVAKVTGTLDYGNDLGQKLPAGALQCALVHAQVSHANIKGIDTSEAEKMPGVFKVVTHKDVKGKNRISGLITFPTNKGDGWDRPILCDEKVFQYGDAIAIVCADTEAHARAAADKVKVDLEVLPAYMSAPAAMAEDAIEIHPGTPNVYYTCYLRKGAETAPIMADSDTVTVEDDFYVQRQPHMPIEPDVGFAYIRDDGMLMMHSKSIGCHLHLYMIVEGLGRTPENAAIVVNPMGGTFGYKFSPTMEALTGVAAEATGRPCFLRYNWRQQQFYTGKRSPFFYHVKYGAKKDGTLLAMEADWSCDHGPYSEFGDLVTLRGAQFCGAGYNWPNIRGEGRCVCTNHAWGSAFRGYGSPQAEFSSEVLMDELAEKLGMDPLELRYKNCYRPGCTTINGHEPEVWSLPDIIDAIRPKYLEAKERVKRESTAEIKKGVGVSIGIYGCGLDGPDTSEAWAIMNADGTITIASAWEDHGQGADVGAITTAHKTLEPMNFPAEKLRFTWPDTSCTPNSGPAGGSRSQYMTGNAIRVACEELLKGTKKDDGKYRTYEEQTAAKLPTKFIGKWTAPAGEQDANTQGKPFGTWMYGMFLAEVAVELATGKTHVEKMTLACDIGDIVNKIVVDGQLYGGLAQGIGLALTEDFEDIQKHQTMGGAGLPTIKQIPDDLEIIYVNHKRETGPHGATGCGELPLTSPHAAIINAIYNACGVRITHLPAYPEKVLAALKAKGKTKAA